MNFTGSLPPALAEEFADLECFARVAPLARALGLLSYGFGDRATKFRCGGWVAVPAPESCPKFS